VNSPERRKAANPTHIAARMLMLFVEHSRMILQRIS
jgi:hypothetical protein